MTTIELGSAKMPYEKNPIHVSANLSLVDDLNDRDQMLTTTEHQQIRRGDVPQISITWQYGTRSELNRGMGSGGAGIDPSVVAAIEPAEMREKAERIIALSDRWHLNTMSPGCIHQPEEWHCSGRDGGHFYQPQGWTATRARHGEHPYPARGDACGTCGRNRWDEPKDACPQTGYRWGTAWLVEIPPAEVIAELRELFEMPALSRQEG